MDTLGESGKEVAGFVKAPLPLVASSALAALSLAGAATSPERTYKLKSKIDEKTLMFLLLTAVNDAVPTLQQEKFMSVGSVSSASSAAYTQAMQRQPEAAESKKTGSDQDGDSDGSSRVQAAATPTSNSNGQIIGQRINVTA